MARKSGSTAETTGPRILAAAERLIARHGYAAVTMRQIAAEVGVQAGALYLYIPDKQSLLFDLMRGAAEARLAAWEAEPKPADPVERLEVFVRFHIGHQFERPDAAFIARMELRNLEEANRAAVEALGAGYAAELERIIAAGAEEGRFRLPDSRFAAGALLAMLDGVDWPGEAGRLGRERVERICWNMLRRAVGA